MATPPSAPIIQNAPRASPNTLEYYWYPPASEGSAPITGYQLTLQPGNLTYTTGLTQYYKVTGLTNGQMYQTSIAATNDNGVTYGPTANFREFQPGSPPQAAPASAVATAVGRNTAVVGWEPPASVPDAPIYWYVIKSTSTNPADPVIITNGYALMQSNVIIQNLNSNSTYYFNVQPVNCPGYGPALSTNTIDLANIAVAGNAAANQSIANLTTLSVGDGDDQAVTFPVPFDFYFFGTNYGNGNNSGIYWNTNNVIGFGTPNNTFNWQANTGRGILVGNADRRTNTFYYSSTAETYQGYSYINIVLYAQNIYNDNMPNGIQWQIRIFRGSQYQFIEVRSATRPATGGQWNITNGTAFQNTYGSFTNVTAGSSFVLRSDASGNNWQFFNNYNIPVGNISPSSFSPTQISGLSLWLDANDETTVVRSGADVTRWIDKSGYSNNSLSNFGTIIYNSNVQIGKNIVQFQQGAFVGGFTPAYTGSAITYFFVGTLSNVNSEFSVIMSVGKYNQPDFNDQECMNVFGRQQNTTNFISYRNLPPYTPTTINPGAYNRYGIAAIVVDGSGPTQTAFYNGTQVGQVTYEYTPNFNMQAWSIGSSDRSSNMSPQYTIFSGNYAEGVLFETALNTSNRQSMEGYLAWKWNLVASLPSNHPYKNAPP